MRQVSSGGGWRAIWYTLRKSRQAGGLRRMYRALRSKNACKTCALGMGGQRGGMVNEIGRFPEVCKKSVQAMAADMQGAIREHFFDDFSIHQLRQFSSRELEAAGRLTQPLIAGPLDSHYKAVAWDDALDRVANALKKTDPDESFFYFSGRSSNEAGFLLQLVARLYGTNNVNNCSYYCHQASGVGLSSVTGSGTATIVLEDLELLGKGDVLLLIGANPSSNHPRFMRTLLDIKRRGGQVIVVNPLRETGLVRFKVPSDPRSLLFGSRIADLYIQPNIGGDIALLTGIARYLLEHNAVDDTFIENATDNWDAFREQVGQTSWEEIIERGGVSRAQIEQVGEIYSKAGKAVFAWAMGLTHHEHGVANVQMIGNVALMRGMIGRPGCGLLPLRGHSNVQGIGSVGVTPKLKDAIFERLQHQFNVNLPTTEGRDTMRCMIDAEAGNMKTAVCLGGNLYGSNPDATFAARAFSKIDTVVYLSTTLNTGHAWGTGRETIILPVLARDEEPQATTQESMFNYVRLSDGGRRRHEGPRSEVEVIADLAERVLRDSPAPIDWTSMRQYKTIRAAIAKIVPGYEAIANIDDTKQEFQISGRTFHHPRFATPNGRARFHAVQIPGNVREADQLRLMTVRSEGQFNTVVYEEEDIYRGQDRRDVIMMNSADIERLCLHSDDLVTVSSECGQLDNIRVRLGAVTPGNAVMYYPEANVLIPRRVDPKSMTPAFKNTLVRIAPAAAVATPTSTEAPEKIAAATTAL